MTRGWFKCKRCLGMFEGTWNGHCTTCRGEVHWEREQERREKRNARRKAYGEAAKAKRLLAQYGITLEFYKRMEKAQGGACAICLEVPDTPLSIDHCHSTGVVRGLLCMHCNTSIGRLADDIDRLRRAIRYLGASKWTQGQDVAGLQIDYGV